MLLLAAFAACILTAIRMHLSVLSKDDDIFRIALTAKAKAIIIGSGQ